MTENRPPLDKIQRSARPFWSALFLMFSDLTAVFIAAFISVAGRFWLGGQFHPSLYWSLWPVLSFFLLANALAGLYPGIGRSPAEELRRVILATTLVYLMLGASTFILRGGEVYSRAIFLIAWIFSTAIIPLFRSMIRHLFAKKSWWGCPVVVLGAGKTGKMVVDSIRRQPMLGLKCVAVLDDDPAKHGFLNDVPVIGGLELAPILAQEKNLPYVIVAMPGIPRQRLLDVIETSCQFFSHVMVIPDLFGFSSLWVKTKDLGGVLGIEVCQRLLLTSSRIIKRMMDLLLTIIGGTFILPLIGFIALLIKLDSRGPVFHSQERIGLGGKKFRAWKFRSMVQNADQILKNYLQENPELRKEWEETQKLKKDPRITRVGRILRKTSLDELPQLWNVLKDEMSLVGPRPIVQNEIVRYGEKFGLYTKVMPGISGLWQISGRNETTYEERVNLDSYYVRNWSVWLDLYILARTVSVVLLGKGAY